MNLSKIMLRCFSSLIIILAMSSSITHAKGEPFRPPVANLPSSCTGIFAGFFCKSSPTFEYALEQEYWGNLGNANYGTNGVGDWVSKTKWYLAVARNMKTKTRARLETFVAFGYVAQYVQGDVFNILNMTKVIGAITHSTIAMNLDPNYANLQSLHYYLNAYLQFATFHPDQGQDFIGQLYDVTQRFGPVEGSEGELVGAMALMLLNDDGDVARGLNTLNKCKTVPCKRKSSVSPYKEVGMQIAIAEGYARLGNKKQMKKAYRKAKRYARKNKHPYPEIIVRSQKALLEPGGVLEAWQTTDVSLGDLKLPLPPSGGKDACQSCHAAGYQTINHFN